MTNNAKMYHYFGLFALVLICSLSPTQIKADDVPFSFDTTIQPRSAEESVILRAPATSSSSTTLDCVEIDFEGLGNNAPIGTIAGSPQIPQVIFGSSWLSIIDVDAGGSGNFANETSPSTTAYFLDQNDISISFDSGAQLVEFHHSAAARSLPVTISAFDADGNLVDRAIGNTIGTDYDGAACSGDPSGNFCLWDKVTLASTSNDIRLVTIVGTVSNYFGIDNLKICIGKCAPPSGGPPDLNAVNIADSCCWGDVGNCLEKWDFAGSIWDDCLLSRLNADSGEKIELWCIAGGLPCRLAPAAAHYELRYFFPDGSDYIVGVCPFEGGMNDGMVFHSGDNDSNGNPDCFIRTRWTSRDYGDRDDDGDGKMDWWVYTYDAVNNDLGKVNYESSDGPGGSDPDVIVVERTDPPLGPETEAFFEALVAEFEQNATAEDERMGGNPFEPCDLNRDGQCDGGDLEIFDAAFESCEGEVNFNSDADFNGDGCVTVSDHQLLFPPVIHVNIDIKPGSYPNCFNNDGKGVIPVAILSDPDSGFDATQVDPSTVRLSGLSIKVAGKSDKLLAHIEDANGDGISDLVTQIQDSDGAFEPGTTMATVTGNLYQEYGGTAIEGTDEICLVP